MKFSFSLDPSTNANTLTTITSSIRLALALALVLLSAVYGQIRQCLYFNKLVLKTEKLTYESDGCL